MNPFHRSSRALLPLALSAALLFSGCQSSGASGSTAEEPAPSSSAAAPDLAQTDAVLSTLTDTELQELISGSATLDQLAQKRTEAVQTETAAPETDIPAGETPSTGTTEPAPAYEQELKSLIEQLYAVKARAESGLGSTIAAAKAEFHALPAKQQTKARKISICMGKASELKALEASCDQDVAAIVAQMRTLLTENGQSTALADEAEASYKAQKSAMVSTLTSQLYG